MKLKRVQFVKKFQLLFILALITAFMGCLPSYHYGFMGSQPAPILNSPYRRSTNYLGGSITDAAASNSGEENVIAKLIFQRNHTDKYVSFSYYIEMFAGYHSIKAVEMNAGEKLDYFGVAPQLMSSLFFPIKKSRLGLYGYSGPFWEFGEYVDWMDEAEKAELIDIAFDNLMGKKLLGGGGLLFEHIYEEESMLSLKLGIGLPGLIHGMVNYRSGSNVFNMGLGMGEHEDRILISLGYMYAW